MKAKHAAREVALFFVACWFSVAAAALLGLVCKALWVAFREGWRFIP